MDQKPGRDFSRTMKKFGDRPPAEVFDKMCRGLYIKHQRSHSKPQKEDLGANVRHRILRKVTITQRSISPTEPIKTARKSDLSSILQKYSIEKTPPKTAKKYD